MLISPIAPLRVLTFIFFHSFLNYFFFFSKTAIINKWMFLLCISITFFLFHRRNITKSFPFSKFYFQNWNTRKKKSKISPKMIVHNKQNKKWKRKKLVLFGWKEKKGNDQKKKKKVISFSWSDFPPFLNIFLETQQLYLNFSKVSIF